jgi:hypothetical protein
MSLTDAGAIAIASALIGDGVIPPFNHANAALGVGDDDTVFAVDQTTLEAEQDSAADDSAREGMDTGYPDRDPAGDGSFDKVRFRSTFGAGDGNFAWAEWGIFNSADTAGGTMLCRVVENLGMKTSSDSWILTIDVTIGST